LEFLFNKLYTIAPGLSRRIIMTMMTESTVLLIPVVRVKRRSVKVLLFSIIFCVDTILTNLPVPFKGNGKII